MKIRSLLLGSVAAAGLSTGAFAADAPGAVLTTLDLCDALGLTGITVSSDNNCLQISGEVKYEFSWGDYRGSQTIAAVAGGYDAFTIIDNDAAPDGRNNDWYSKVEAYFKVVGTADTDVGPARAVIKFKDIDETQTRNENNLGANGIPDASILRIAGPDGALGNIDDLFVTAGPNGAFDSDPNDVAVIGDDVFLSTAATNQLDDFAAVGGDNTVGFVIDEAYVSIGGATVLSAGRKGTIINYGDDVPFTWLNLFLSEKVDSGVKFAKDVFPDGGHVIQVVHDFGNGLSGGVGLENLNGTGAKAGTAVGVLSYAGERFTAHVSGVAGGILDGTVENWGVHAGFTGTFTKFKIRGAIAGNQNNVGGVNSTYWNGLASAELNLDMFRLAWAGEAAQGTGIYSTGGTDFGAGASATIKVTDGITINLGGRFYQDANGPDGYQIAASLGAAITETLTLTGEAGVYGVTPGTPLGNPSGTSANDIYGKVTLAWAPGGGFTSSVIGEVHQNGGYKATFKAGKVID